MYQEWKAVCVQTIHCIANQPQNVCTYIASLRHMTIP